MGQMIEGVMRDPHSESGNNEYLKFGCSSHRGFRISMEDRSCCKTDFKHDVSSMEWKGGSKIPPLGTSFFAVFDGFSGQTAAHFCSQHLPGYLLCYEENRQIKGGGKGKHRFFSCDDSLEKSFLAMDKEFQDIFKGNPEYPDNSGSTCVSVLVVPYGREQKIELICCNIGDSRCIFYDRGQIVPMSKNLGPTSGGEKKRILNAGGFVKDGRMFMILGNLCLSRCFGSVVPFKNNKDVGYLDQCVNAIPEIQRYLYDMTKFNEIHPHSFLVLASDGLWDVASPAYVYDFIRKRLKEQENGTFYKN